MGDWENEDWEIGRLGDFEKWRLDD